MKGKIKVLVTKRPYLLTFHASGGSFLLTSEEAQRLLNEYPAVEANQTRVVLPGHDTNLPQQRCSLSPATLGGGPAFIIWEQ